MILKYLVVSRGQITGSTITIFQQTALIPSQGIIPQLSRLSQCDRGIVISDDACFFILFCFCACL